MTSVLSGCLVMVGCGLRAPTYGTDKTASLQFLSDIVNVASSKKSTNVSDQFAGGPRPNLILPGPGMRAVLPLPQEDATQIGSSGGAGSFVPYQKRLQNGTRENLSKVTAREYLYRQQEMLTKDANHGQNLSEPPPIYRQPAKTAPISQRGKDEETKRRERKRATYSKNS